MTKSKEPAFGVIAQLRAIPAYLWRRLFYLLWSLAGPVLIYLRTKGVTGTAEYELWMGLGTVLGFTALVNAKPARRQDQL